MSRRSNVKPTANRATAAANLADPYVWARDLGWVIRQLVAFAVEVNQRVTAIERRHERRGGKR